MNTVAIFGVGLIGGSFALALRKAGFAGTILGVGSESTLARAQQLHIIDAGASPRTAAQEADLLYLAQPVHAILTTIAELNAWVRPGALVTDAGSTKRVIMETAAKSLTRVQFLGGHPLAGKERRGADAADADLFEGRTYVLTPDSEAGLRTPAALEFQSWLKRIGSVPVVMSSAQHDSTVAVTSHLPQMASVALAMLLCQKDSVRDNVFGPALLDATRLALSPYDIWRDILATNTDAIDSALIGYIRQLETLRRDLGSAEMATHFRQAGALASRLRGQET
ncbi:MAG: prephenate dehydrogenase [Bryobacteraceae bacterium]